LDSLEDNLLIQVFRFLNANDLYNLSQSCKRLNRLSSEDELWKFLFKRDFAFQSVTTQNRSWKELYKRFSTHGFYPKLIHKSQWLNFSHVGFNNSNSSSIDFFFNIYLMGSSQVGKTSFLLRFTDGTFYGETNLFPVEDAYIRTIEVQGFVVRLKLCEATREKLNTEKETQPPEAETHLRRSEKRKSHPSAHANPAHLVVQDGVMVVYDVTNEESFHHVSNCLTEANKQWPGAVKVLVGNKSDCANFRKVPIDRLCELAESECIPWWEVSAKEGTNVEDAFLTLAESALWKYQQELNPKGPSPTKHRSSPFLFKILPPRTKQWLMNKNNSSNVALGNKEQTGR